MVFCTAAMLACSAGASPAIRGLTTGQGTLQTADERLVMQHELDAFSDQMMSGGPPPDGIPSIDNPQFISASEANMDPGDKVIGVAYNGIVRAYPHAIMVLHEIVNDQFGGENFAVTYCPLTATAQGFKTGSTTLGVSGQLSNSNLVMYDRDTGSLWPQIAATAVAGERKGESLQEVDITWTTWGQWLDEHPDTEVLSTRTGAARDYRRDPYGSYNPIGGYYRSNSIMFPVMHQDDALPPKHMVSGARTTERAVMFDLEALAAAGIQQTEHFLGVFNEALGNAHIYETDGSTQFQWQDGRVVNADTGTHYSPDTLPLNEVISIEAFYFAWNAFYPMSERP